MPRADLFDCTLTEAAAYTGCTECASWRQLWAALALVLCKLNGGDVLTDCSPEALLEECHCYDCMSDKQMFGAGLAMFVTLAVENGYIEAGTLLHDIECLACLDPKRVRAIVLCQLCKYLNSQVAEDEQ
jgi:hypothetical protein